jgi:putative FmdB family regulatory protein
MPLYEYQCEACGQRFEVIQKFSDPPVETCRGCGGAVKKLLSSPAIQFKGSGWYITDYARKSGDATKSGDGTTSSADGSKAAASGDAKPSTSSTTAGDKTASS